LAPGGLARASARRNRLFGSDRFYGFMGSDNDQWHPKLFTALAPGN
jgi:hypothetical protein